MRRWVSRVGISHGSSSASLGEAVSIQVESGSRREPGELWPKVLASPLFAPPPMRITSSGRPLGEAGGNRGPFVQQLYQRVSSLVKERLPHGHTMVSPFVYSTVHKGGPAPARDSGAEHSLRYLRLPSSIRGVTVPLAR